MPFFLFFSFSTSTSLCYYWMYPNITNITIIMSKITLGLAATLGLKVFVNREKKIILECLESPEISSVLTNDPSSAGLHVLPMAKLNMNVC